MIRQKWTMLAGAALSVALLAGCGDKADNGSAAAATALAADAGGGQPAGAAGDADGGPGGGMRAMGMGTMGKIKSVAGSTITIYKSSFQPGQGGGRQGGSWQGGDRQGAGGAAPSGDAQPSGDPPSPSQPADGGQASGRGGQGGQWPDMSNMFTDETEEITVSAATKIYKTEMADGKRTETEIAIGDLKADDIVTVTLKEGTQEAESIRLGGFGGFGGGMRGGRGQAQGGGESRGQAQAGAAQQAG